MPTIDFGEGVDGVEFVSVTVSDTDWDTYTWGDSVEAVQIRSRSGDFYVSRTETGTFSAADTTYLTVPDGREFALDVTPSRSPRLLNPRVASLQLSHSSASGVFEFELRRGGR